MARETLVAAAVTDTGRLRGHNEDVANVSEVQVSGMSYLLWMVADGLGGGIRGEEASALACDELLAALNDTASSDPVAALVEGVHRANAAVYAAGSENGTLTVSRMGTTLVAALVEPESRRYWLVNVGDSRGYLVKGGLAAQLTTDHSLVAEAAAAGLLTEEQARNSLRKNVVTRAIGTEREVEPETFGPLELAADELLLLCSDGLHGMIDDAAIGRLASEGTLQRAAEALKDAANAAGGRDNISVVLGGWRTDEPATQTPSPSAEDRSARAEPQGGGLMRWAAVALAVAVAAAAAIGIALTSTG